MSKITNVDEFLSLGCGRCDYFKTLQCKVHTWQKELIELRRIMLDCGLTEEIKWSQPTYTLNGKNLFIVSAFNNYAFISFFQGVLINDEANHLQEIGKNTQAARQWRFTNAKDILANETTIKVYIFEAIELEKAGIKVELKKEIEPLPEELLQKMNAAPDFKAAFEALTPGRQRSYILHISSAKQAKTRQSRVEKCIPKIFSGKGFNER